MKLKSFDKVTQLYNLPLFFHWSYAHKTIEDFKAEEMNQLQTNELVDLVAYKNKLKEKKIWIKNIPNKNLSLWDLYQVIIADLTQQKRHDFMKQERYISTVSSMGPFSKTSFLSLVNSKELRYYIYEALLKDYLPHRNFRVATQEMIPMKYGATEMMAVLQEVTDGGMLLRLPTAKAIKLPQEGELEMTCSMDHLQYLTESLTVFKDNDTSVFKIPHAKRFIIPRDKKNFEMKVPLESIHFSKSSIDADEKVTYIFIPFKALEEKQKKIWSEFSDICRTQLLNVA